MRIAGSICLGLAILSLVQAFREAKRRGDWQHAEWTVAAVIFIVAAFALLIRF